MYSASARIALGMVLPLPPHIDRARSSGENGGVSGRVGNSLSDVCELDIIKDESSTRRKTARITADRSNTDRGIHNTRVKKDDRADGLLGRSISSNIKTNLAFINSDRLESPCPIPVHVDRSPTVVELEIPGHELLVAKECSKLAPVEDQV